MLLTAGVLTACGGSSTTTDEASDTSEDTSEETIEYMLASLDAGSPVDQDDPAIDEFSRALDRLEAVCTAPTRRSIGDYAVKSQEYLRDNPGEDVPLSRILDQVQASIPPGSPQMQCSEIFATWVVIEQAGP